MIDLLETKKLFSAESEALAAHGLLAQVLRSCIELVSLEDNDFSWSSWKDKSEALKELQGLLQVAENGGTPELIKLSVLFAPTGPIQEVSLSSGWGDAFIRVSEKYDLAERQIWRQCG